MKNAYTELMDSLEDGEIVECLVFGAWGWESSPDGDEDWQTGCGEPENSHVPFKLRGKQLTLEEATPFMQNWSFYGGYGAPDCYATYIWTNQRIFWVTQYDGSTSLDSAPRHPSDTMPNMPGG